MQKNEGLERRVDSFSAGSVFRALVTKRCLNSISEPEGGIFG